jgi:flagellar biogenesis protein FliO
MHQVVLARLLTAVTMILLGAHPARLAAQAVNQTAAAEEQGPDARQSTSPGVTGPPAPLAPPNATPRAGANRDPGGLSSVLTVGGSLAAVLAGFFVIAWAFRRASPRGFGVLPPEAFEVLGRAPLANRQQAQLLRCGNKLLLVAVNPEGAETLTEITDPAEVERLAAVCHRARPSGSALGQVFRRREERDA